MQRADAGEPGHERSVPLDRGHYRGLVGSQNAGIEGGDVGADDPQRQPRVAQRLDDPLADDAAAAGDDDADGLHDGAPRKTFCILPTSSGA